jgi:hypothetical protein
VLASLVERDPGYAAAWLAAPPSRPYARSYILRVADRQRPLPFALERVQVPSWPHLHALSAWLGITDGGLWRLARPAAWRRREPLAEQPYRCRLIPKRTGGLRLLEVPEPWLMALQRRLLDDLLERLPPHEAACGYVRGRSVVDHAHAHAGRAVVLRFDLSDFFTSVRAARVHALFATLGYSDAVARALAALCTTATPEPVLRRLHEDGRLPWPRLQRLRDAHLPQGAPTSPALANLCAFGLDVRLAGLARAVGARYTRYADDLVLSGPSSLRDEGPRLAARVAAIAAEEGFALNHRKTRSLSAGVRQTVCGLVVDERPNLPRAEYDRLKAVLHQCVRDGPSSQDREGHADWPSVLRGRVAWAQQVNPAKGARLAALLARIDWSR